MYFEQLLALNRVRKERRPTAEPRYGSPLERLFGTAETEFIHHLLGNTQASKQSRLKTKETDPRRHAVWTLETLAEHMEQWAYEEYDTIPHPALHGQSPREAYDLSIGRDGERLHKKIPYDKHFSNRKIGKRGPRLKYSKGREVSIYLLMHLFHLLPRLQALRVAKIRHRELAPHRQHLMAIISLFSEGIVNGEEE